MTQPFLPLFFGDLLAATPTWDGEERALYVLLLAYQWSAGAIPDDPKRIAKMCQYDPKTFASLWKVVGKKFVSVDGGLANPRLEEHRAKAKEIGKKRADAGAKGAANRWQKDGNCQEIANGKEIASATVLPSHPYHPNPDLNPRAGIPPSGAPVSDPRKAIFDLGVSIMGEKKRSLIGKAISEIGEAKVAEIIGAMAAKPPVDPGAYFAAAVQPKARGAVC